MIENTKKSILLIHGLGGSPAELAYLKIKLEVAGYNVFTPTLPGHGTHANDLKALKWTDYTHFVEQEFLKLKQTNSWLAIGGNCMGAVLALWLAAKHQGKISCVVPISTTLFFDGWGLPSLSKYLSLVRNSPVYFFYNLEVSKYLGIKDDGIREWIRSNQSSNSVTHYSKIPFRAVWEFELLCRQTRTSIKRIVKPIFVVHAEEDEVTSMRSVHCIKTQTSPFLYSELILNNSYHLVTIDRERALVAKSVLGFLNHILDSESETLPYKLTA